MSKMSYKTITHCELTVIRPNGKTEIVTLTDKRKDMNDHIFAQIVKGTKAAGKGELVSYRVFTKDVTRDLTANEEALKLQTEDEMKMQKIQRDGFA